MNTFLLMLFTITCVFTFVLIVKWFAVPAFGRWLMRRVADDERGETK